MKNMLTSVLKNCKFDNLKSVDFSASNLELTVNNTPKHLFGKGYKSFVNSCLAITIREYLEKFGMHNPGLLIIDSPITTFDSGVDDNTPESMKHSLMMHLVKTQEIGQTIILENKIPDIDYEYYGVNTIEFTKGKKNGRYGFLNDVRN